MKLTTITTKGISLKNGTTVDVYKALTHGLIDSTCWLFIATSETKNNYDFIFPTLISQ